MKRFRTRLQLAAILAAAVLALTAAVPPLSLSWVNAARLQRESVEAQVLALRDVQSVLVDAETGQRGFIITGAERFLDVYRQATGRLPAALRHLEELYRDESDEERAIVAAIDRAARAKAEELSKTVELRRQQGFAAVEPIVSSGEGKRHMDETRQAVADLIRREDAEVSALENGLQSKITAATTLSLISAALTLLMLGVLGRAMWLALRMREVAASQANEASERAESGMAALRVLNAEVSTLSEMSRVLQTEMSMAESLEITSHFCVRLLPGTRGAIYLFRNSADLLEQVATWGVDVPTQAAMEPSDCWGLRRGQMHVRRGGDGLRCRHEAAGMEGTTVCLPLMAYGEMLGLLTVPADDALDAAAADALAAKVRQIAEQVSMSLSNAKLRQVLRDQSIKDPLTGLFNRRYMEETMAREIVRAHRRAQALAVIVADLDHFKKLNDAHGHPAGDAVLKAAAQQMQRLVRGSDVACRFGGEEFVLILPECTRLQAVEKAQELCEKLRRLIVHTGGEELRVTGSFGVAAFPDDGELPTELIEAADQALYAAKRQGRDRVCVATGAAADTPANTRG